MLFRLSSLYIRHCSFPRRLWDDTVCPDRASRRSLVSGPPHADTTKSLFTIFKCFNATRLSSRSTSTVRRILIPRSGFRRRFLPVYLESRPDLIPESLSERVQLFVSYFRWSPLFLILICIYRICERIYFQRKRIYLNAVPRKSHGLSSHERRCMQKVSMDNNQRLDLQCVLLNNHCLSFPLGRFYTHLLARFRMKLIKLMGWWSHAYLSNILDVIVPIEHLTYTRCYFARLSSVKISILKKK